jgi:hypothetical protein
MALKKDKQKVLGETFDDERVRTFLEPTSRNGFDGDYLLLERAYRGMKADNFETFLRFFNEAGHNINAQNPDGMTLLQIAQEHTQSADYVKALKAAGAN